MLYQSQLDGIEALVDSLESLDVYKFKDRDLARLKGFSKLETLKLINNYKLESTDGVADLAGSLKYLELSYCRKLADLSGVQALKNLRLLWLMRSAKAVKDLGFISLLPNLEVLMGSTNCASLLPLHYRYG